MITFLAVLLGIQGVLNAGAALASRNGLAASLNLVFAASNGWAVVLLWRLS